VLEVLLDRDPQPDLARRVNAYPAGGAGEVILVSPDGQLEFWGARVPAAGVPFRNRAAT
jgi:hypothetical protein